MKDETATAVISPMNAKVLIRKMKAQGKQKVEVQEALRARGYSLASACVLLRDNWNG
jgi:hypothetical protein